MESIDWTIDLALSLDPEYLQISMATPFPVTPFCAWARDSGYLLAEGLAPYDRAQSCVLCTEALTAQEIVVDFMSSHQAWKECLGRKRAT